MILGFCLEDVLKKENPHSPRIGGFPTYQTIGALTTSTHIIVFKLNIK
jgi:hypothetical protein